MVNKILNNTEREFYKESINELYSLCPQTIKRKIVNANVQQGFVLQTTKNLAFKESEILSVGSYDDTASESLIKLGFNVKEIDPAINMDLHTYYINNSNKKFDIIISTSVIEHVENDELFVEEICKLLKNGGYGILTCDFKNNYKKGDNKPSVDYRLYTKNDLLERLRKILIKNDCDIYGNYDYDSEPDFIFENCLYSFATYVFKKIN
jgi:SAM-dependent methyltransferase